MTTNNRSTWALLVVTTLLLGLLLTLLSAGGVGAQTQDDCTFVCLAYGCPSPPPCLSDEFVYRTYIPWAGNTHNRGDQPRPTQTPEGAGHE